jgi:ribokinase
MTTVPSRKVDAVDTTAAGDTFCGALCTALTQDKTLPEAMHYGCKAAAVSVTRRGAQMSMPYKEEIED